MKIITETPSTQTTKLTVTYAAEPDPAKWRAGIRLLTAIALEILAEKAAIDQPAEDKADDNLEHEEPGE